MQHPSPPRPLADVRVIDTDSHVIEPADLWTSRVASKYGDAAGWSSSRRACATMASPTPLGTSRRTVPSSQLSTPAEPGT